MKKKRNSVCLSTSLLMNYNSPQAINPTDWMGGKIENKRKNVGENNTYLISQIIKIISGYFYGTIVILLILIL